MYYEVYRDGANYWRWRLKAANHQIVAISGEGYHNRGDCEHAIDLVKSSADALVKEI